MDPEEMLFELKPCDECSHSCVEGQVGVKCPYDLIVEPILNKTNMKTQKEIEELAKEEYKDYLHNPFFTAAPMGYLKGYTQCQDDILHDQKVTRFEVIDENGRVYVAKDCKVELSYQDDGRTLKVFIKPL